MKIEMTRCQSDGQRIFPGFFGTEADGSLSKIYCKFCYKDGKFTEPDITLEEMIHKSVNFMVNNLKMPEDKSEQMSREVISSLKRCSL